MAGSQRSIRAAISSRPGVFVVAAVYLAVLAAFSSSASVMDRFPGEVTFTTWVQSMRTGWLDSALREAFTSGVIIWVVPLLALTIVMLLLKGKRRESLVLVAAAALTVVVDFGLSEAVARPRPSSDLVLVSADFDGHSFPSSHVTYWAVFLGTLAVLTTWDGGTGLRRWVVYAGLSVALTIVGFSRVYLGAHWLGDVLGGYVLGAGIVVAAALGWRLWEDREAVSSRGVKEPAG